LEHVSSPPFIIREARGGAERPIEEVNAQFNQTLLVLPNLSIVIGVGFPFSLSL